MPDRLQWETNGGYCGGAKENFAPTRPAFACVGLALMSVFRIVLLPSPIIHTEVSMIQASLLNGAYVSQYDMRATANPGVAQYLEKVPFAVF